MLPYYTSEHTCGFVAGPEAHFPFCRVSFLTLFHTVWGRHAHTPLRALFETKPNQNKHYFQDRIQESELEVNGDVNTSPNSGE